ncbi:MgtC/SapB family protein [Aliarcobacter butzleri]|uniref:MgtC/SapB family protein n=1 Tax=Aliarcobacter butzleri TaxID=28197 RepID=UPI003AF4F937
MDINLLLTYFILTTVFSFLIGLELKAYKMKFHENDSRIFLGTTRTYTFIGIIGFIFYKIEPNNFSVYIAGFLAITLLYSMLYYRLLAEKNSIVLYLVAVVVYSFGPLTNLFPFWLSSLIFVVTIFLLNAKKRLLNFNLKINIYEIETLGKMILLSAVVLPLLPEDKIIPYLGISLYKIWLTVVVISAISYAGYIVQKYLFPSKGIFLTGIIGGIYSSTATTVVLSKKAQGLEKNHLITASVIAATLMMYLRLIIISYIFNVEVVKTILIPFLALLFICAIITLVYYKKASNGVSNIEVEDSNPLELGTAFIFAFLFIITMLITNFVVDNYGSSGLKFLSIIIGFTDIDPFILSLLTGKYSIDSSVIASAIIIAAGSNNILKAVYTIWFGKDKTISSFVWLLILGILTILVGFFI